MVAILQSLLMYCSILFLQFKMSVCTVLEAVLAKADGCIKNTEGTLHTARQENELFDLIIEETSYVD